MKVFVDAGAFIAFHDRGDDHHESAVRAWDEFERRGWRAVTTSFMIEEAVSLIAAFVSYDDAVDLARWFFSGEPALDIVPVAREQEIEAIGYFDKLRDQGVGFSDCLSFAVIRAHRLRRAFTYDRRHFRPAAGLLGFELWPLR